jgi:hypothetical protein
VLGAERNFFAWDLNLGARFAWAVSLQPKKKLSADLEAGERGEIAVGIRRIQELRNLRFKVIRPTCTFLDRYVHMT